MSEPTVLSAEDWYIEFLDEFGQDRDIRKAYKKREIGRKEWTSLILQMLEKLGKRLGYSVKREKLRVDMAWYKGGNAKVGIEHENAVNNVEKLLGHEVDNLLSFDSELKVLITYFKPSTFPSLSGELHHAISKKLSEHNRYHFDFLVALNSWKQASTPDDEFWVAYWYKPTFKSQVLHYPSL